MTRENLIRLFPLFRSRWTSPVIKIYVVWLTRAGWPNFLAAYQNTQTAKSYQPSRLSEGCGKGRSRSRSFSEVPSQLCPLARGWTWGGCLGLPVVLARAVLLAHLLSQLEKQIPQQPWCPTSPNHLLLDITSGEELHLNSLQSHIA